MDLHKALTKAAAFAWNGKQRSGLKNVSLLPRQGELGPRVYASQGSLGIMVYVDAEDLPNVAVDSDALKAILAGTKGLTVEVSHKQVVFTDSEGGQHTTIPQDMTGSPGIPPVPREWTTVQDWWAVEKVLHCVSKDKQQPHLQCVHFREGAAEATDRFRMARVFVDLPLKGLLSADTFRQWPKNLETLDLAVVDDSVVWLRMGDEIRLSCLMRAYTYSDLEPALPKVYNGPAVAVDREELTAAVKKAVATKEEGISLGFTPQVQAIGIVAGSFSTGINCKVVRGTSVAWTKHVNAKWLQSALRVCTTPKVLLGYGDIDPLRVESGPFVEGLWPLQT